MARKTTKRKKSDTPKPQHPVSRRAAMARLGWYGFGAAAVLGVGGAFAMDFRNKLAEADLGRIGQGVPTIVQIHDPSCTLCAELQPRKIIRAPSSLAYVRTR